MTEADFNEFMMDTGGVSLAEPAALDNPVATATDGWAEVAAAENTARYRPAGQPAAAAPAAHTTKKSAAAAQPAAGEPLYFDLETIPDYSRLEYFGLPPLPEIPKETPPAGLPDIDKVVAGTVDQVKSALRKIVGPSEWLDKLAAAEASGPKAARAGVLDAINENRNVVANVQAMQVERVKLLSTTPEYCSIACMSWGFGRGEIESLYVGGKNDLHMDGEPITEMFLLSLFWSLARKYSPLVVYNGLGFDLPVIFARSAILGVPSSKRIDLSPFSANKDVVDLYIRRFGAQGNRDANRPGKLKRIAPVYGIPVPAGDVDGSQVAELMKSDPAKVAKYCESDVHILRELHRKLAGYFWS